MTVELEGILAESELNDKQKELLLQTEKRMRTRKKASIPFRILKEAAIAGSAFYIGFMDGTGTPLNPEIKYTLLATPTLLSVIINQAAVSVGQKILRKEVKKNYLKDIVRKLPEDKKDLIKEGLHMAAYSNGTPDITKQGTITALKTGISYALGYGLANWV